MGTMASQITSLTIVYSTVNWGTDQRKHQSSAPLAFVWGIHRWPVNSPYKRPVTWKMFPFDDVIMIMVEIMMVNYVIYASRILSCNAMAKISAMITDMLRGQRKNQTQITRVNKRDKIRVLLTVRSVESLYNCWPHRWTQGSMFLKTWKQKTIIIATVMT